MRYIYTVLFYLILPFALMRLLWRSVRQPAYRHRLGERLGSYPFKLDRCLWVHAVSVGEVVAAAPLIRKLILEYPMLPMLVTTMTVTGSERVKLLFGDEVKHVYLPYDVPCAIKRFLKAMNPVACIIMETELWPNLITVCKKKRVPVCITNARLSAKSLVGYQKIGSLLRKTLRKVDWIAANSQADANRFITLGTMPGKVNVTGNIKFDITISEDLIANSVALKNQIGNRFVWVAASTHEGEEEIIIAAHKRLLVDDPTALLILVPRHPQRFDVVAALSQATFVTGRRSEAASLSPETAVYLADTMGEVMLMYAVSDVAFVGGSFIKRGGHNMLEPAVLGKPIITGEHLFNFVDISDMLLLANAMTVVSDEQTLAAELLKLKNDTALRKIMGEHAKVVVEKNRGALAAQLALIKKWIRIS